MRFLTAVWVLVCTSVDLSSAAEDPPNKYYYFKQPVTLPLNAARIAYLSESSSFVPGGAVAELASEPATPLAISNWHLATTINASASSAGVSATVAALSRAPAVAFASPVFTGTDGGPLIVTPTILVAFDQRIPQAQAEMILTNNQAGDIQARDWAGMKGTFRVKSRLKDGFTVLEVANRLAQLPEVLYAEPDFIFTGRGSLIPNDPGFSNSWGIHNVGQFSGTVDADMDGPEAWDISTGDASIKVLIIDVGVQQDHPDINQLPGGDFTSNGGDGGPVNTCDHHGTPVAGCVSGIINNAVGGMGIAPSCMSISARFAISSVPCDGTWTSQASWTVDALAFGESMGVRVTNNSNYYGFSSPSIASKYATMRANGVVHFASAGNSNLPTSTYPASLPTVNSIAALNNTGARASFSNYGSDIFVSAPGEFIYTTDRTGFAGYASGAYAFVQGTSFASPYTAGVAALVLSVNPALSAADVESILADTAVDLGTNGWDSNTGWGFVNAHRALVEAAGGCHNPGPPDCNNNGEIDSCDLFNEVSQDSNSNGVPDECEAPASVTADITGLSKSRFVSFVIPASPTTSALRVTLTSLHHVVPPYSGGPSVPFTNFEGQVRWVGPPAQYGESTAVPTPFFAASLQCTPHYQDWSTVGLLHVTGSGIVPSSIYEIENVAAGCTGVEDTCAAVSAPLTVVTSRWADVETPYNPPSTTAQPDLADVSALLNKFRSAPGAPIKARSLLVGNDTFGNILPATLSQDVSFTHISVCVDAFRGQPYPHTIASCP